MTFNGSPCVVGDAVTRQTAHPLLQQPLQLFPMEVLEQALEQVRPAYSSGPREAALQSRVVWLVVFHSITLPPPPSPAVHLAHQEVRPPEPVPRK